ncbi:peptidylprolyl isomerase [Umezakia ovalisporum]|uniref:peptidylprolyl isomerase n=1 Tax=Umezakia ovalisporum FSS-62 TaxID=2971776 RepID=A0AA43KEF1_9CYAN|nr:peptidylprolyl isomerase [Umezakia ovalisporum]MDH6063225.1 peptidylprolyl isomerase [Umezakia ovalisporum FSS-62]MDH6101792.1 peptidylprolyl isomerase [Umezakia ovalisporum ANA283AFssAo]
MESSSFLLVNDQPIFINQAVKYLQASGKLAHFIGDILRQYVIEQEIQRRDDIEISPGLTEQTIIDFRIKNQLNDHQIFQEWLQKNGTDYTSFYESIAFGFKLEKLKVLITETKITEYFIERKIFLDRLIVSRIVVENREIAEELQTQIEEGGSFEQLAREYSLTEDRILNGMMGLVSRGTMPHQLRAVIDMANPGQVVGPIEMEGRYGLFRVEQFLPASLEDIQIKQALENELFEKWLVEKIQKLTVKVQMS